MTIVGDSFYQFEPRASPARCCLPNRTLPFTPGPSTALSPSMSTSATTRPTIRPRRSACFARCRTRMNPQRVKFQAIHRGGRAMPPTMHRPLGRTPDLQPGVLTEYLTDDYGIIRSLLARVRAFPDAVSRRSKSTTRRSFGKLFRLDGHLMTSEKDEFFYHENLVHVAAITHPAPETALIIGGGDGGSAEELLKHPTIEVGDPGRDRSRRARHRAQVPWRGPSRRAVWTRECTVKVEDGLRVRARRDRHLRSDRARPHRSGRRVGTAVQRRVLPGVRRAAESHRRDDAAIASPVAHPERIRAAIANLRAVFSGRHPVPGFRSRSTAACG